VHTDGKCAAGEPITIQFGAGNPGPSATVNLTTATAPTGSGPFVYTSAPVPTNGTWTAGVVTATVKSGTRVLGTIQVTVS
jgi:hypothetical protein